MQAAAHSLGMTFEVQYAQREPLKTLDIAREMVARPAGKRPNYIVVTDDYSVADRLLAIIDPAGVKTFLAYSSIPVDQRGGIGSPRSKYKGWLGSLEPQAEDAGYLTARALIERGKKEKAFGADRKLHMLAIAGDRSTPSSINRNQGMRRAVAEAPMVVLEEEVYAAWARENAAQQAESLYRRYPDVKLVWAGNDLMAFGAMSAWEKRGGKPGVDAWFSGINTSTEALEAVKSGRLTSLAGGHFISGAWALVMIYDYHHGRDFADEGLELKRPMFAEFTPVLADRYIERFSGGFDGVDFSRYSKVKNPQLKRYNFGFAQLLEPQS
jgi:ABC-type sugar transport system substrate-binding protein